MNYKVMLKEVAATVLAGVSIALGAFVYLKVGGVVGATMFSIGLLAVITFRFPLYTGRIKDCNNFIEAPLSLVKVLVLNAVGCGLISLMIDSAEIVAKCQAIVELRSDAGFWTSVYTGAGCGFIITLAVVAWKRTPLPLLIGIPAFILSGLTHSVADVFYYCVGHEAVDAAAMTAYCGTAIGNFVGGIIFKIGDLSHKLPLTSTDNER